MILQVGFSECVQTIVSSYLTQYKRQLATTPEINYFQCTIGIVYTKNQDSADFAMTSLNKQCLSHIRVFQPLKAIKVQIQFWTDVQSTEITQPLKKFGL